MSETDPLRDVLRWLAADRKLDEEAVRRGVFGADEASIAGCRKMLEQILAEYPEPVTHTQYGVYATPEAGVIETKGRYLALIAIKDNPDAIMVTRQVTAWEPVKEEA